MQFSCHVTKLDIVRCLIAVNVNREVYFEHMLSKFPVNVGFEINSAVFCVEVDLLADDGIHHFALDLQGCTDRTVFCPLHAAHALYLPGFLGMEDVQIPCAVLQRFILIDPQFISCFSDLKYFTVIFFVKQGSKFGVKIRSEAPSIHMIRANIETEIAPIVGNEKQAEDLAGYIKKGSETPEGVWGTNIFGKTVEELVMDREARS